MEISYEKKTVSRHGSTVKKFVFSAPYQLLETLLSVEVRSSFRVYEAVTEVISGEILTNTLSGNVITLMIGQEMTILLDHLSADGIGNACCLPTTTLVSILSDWHESD